MREKPGPSPETVIQGKLAIITRNSDLNGIV